MVFIWTTAKKCVCVCMLNDISNRNQLLVIVDSIWMMTSHGLKGPSEVSGILG